jgi:two-component system chemotaxis sensor kinase CheA
MSQATTEPLVKAELEDVLSRLRSDGRLEDGTRLEERLLHLLGAKGFPKAFQTQAKRLANFCRKLEDGDADMASGLRRLEEGLSKLLLGWPMSEAPNAAVAHPPVEPPPAPPEPQREARGLLEIFLQGQVDRLQELEVLCLEREKGNPGALPRIQGALHNLKGEFGVLGMPDWADLVHEVESLVAEDRLETDALLALVDMLGTHAGELAKGRFLGVDPDQKARLGLAAPDPVPEPIPSPPMMPESAIGLVAPRDSRPDMPSSGGGSCAPWMQDPSFLADFVTESMEHIRSIETALLRLETEPTAEDSLHSAFRAFHTIKGLAAFLKLPRIRELAHAAESVLDLVRKHELALTSAHVDILLVAADALCTTIRGFDPERARDGRIEPEAIVPAEILDRLRHPETIVPPPVSEFPESVEPLGRMLVKCGIASDAIVGEALDRQVGGDDRPLGEILVQEMHLKAVEVGHLLGMQARQKQHLTGGAASAEPPPATPALPNVQDPGSKEGSPRTEVQGAVEDSIRVPVDRLDMLIDAIGEAVIAQSMVFADPRIREAGDLALEKKMAQSAVMLRRIQELSMSLRMVAIRQTFQKMARLVRDLSRKQGKLVDLELEGESTELDKTVVENIGDPLVHMIRNAVDHGLESPEARKLAGKSETAAG